MPDDINALTAKRGSVEIGLGAIESMALVFSDGSIAPIERMGSSFHAAAPTTMGVVPVALQIQMKPPAPPAADG